MSIIREFEVGCFTVRPSKLLRIPLGPIVYMVILQYMWYSTKDGTLATQDISDNGLS